MTVHVIVHSHDDVGWRKTVDNYFTGENTQIHPGSAKLILDSVVDTLIHDPKRYFSFCEMKFFTMWYKMQDQKMKEEVKRIVRNGQLELLQGGWVAPDEACPNYEDMIMNMFIGHQFIKREFGVRPKIGWMLDGFGHSAATASLYSDFGFDAIFFARIAVDDKNFRDEDRKKSFIWKPFSKHFGDQKEIYTYIFPGGYGFEYSISFVDQMESKIGPQIQDDPTLPNYNAEKQATDLINWVQKASEMYTAKENFMFQIGDDFTFMNSQQDFDDADKLINMANKI